MSQNSEPILHDRQCVIDQTPQSTSSTTFVDVTNATVTTKDLGSEANYDLFFSVVISALLNNTTASFRILVNGSPVGMARDLVLRIKETDVGFTFLGCIDGISEGDVIQVQWKTDIGTITLSEFNLLMDGIPEIRVIT